MLKKEKVYTICCQSGRILLMVPTSFVVFVITITTLVMELVTGNSDYKIGWQLLGVSILLLLLMIPGLVVSALWGKKLCKADEEGIRYKGKLIRWTSIEKMEYVYGYSRYYGDHTYMKVIANGEETRLPRGPFWLPLLVRRHTSEFTVSYPHVKRHLLIGGIIGAVLSAIIIGIYFL